MTCQLIGGDRYKIYLDRVPARSLRLHIDEIKEISELNPDYLYELEESKKTQEYYDDVVGDIEAQAEAIRKMEETIENIKNSKQKAELKDLLDDIADAVAGHL